MCPFQVVLACVKGLNGKTRASAYVLQQAVLQYYSDKKLFPSGLVAELPAVASWALKQGFALKKLATQLTNIINMFDISSSFRVSQLTNNVCIILFNSFFGGTQDWSPSPVSSLGISATQADAQSYNIQVQANDSHQGCSCS